MEHFKNLIVDFNITHIRKSEYFDQAFYDDNIFELLDVYPNLTYFNKTSKFINMFSNIKKTISHEIYIYKKIR